jgi:hypothetical protein
VQAVRHLVPVGAGHAPPEEPRVDAPEIDERRHARVRHRGQAGHKQRHGDKSMWAMHELTTTDKDTNLTVLRPEVIRACRVLLGPVPGSEEYPAYWRKMGKEPPAEHQPPEAEPEAKKPRGRTRAR